MADKAVVEEEVKEEASHEEPESDIEEPPKQYIKAEISTVAKFMMEIITSPLEITKEISYKIMLFNFNKLNRMSNVLMILHGGLLLYQIIWAVYIKEFSLLHGSPPMILVLLSMGVSYFLMRTLMEMSESVGFGKISAALVDTEDDSLEFDEDVELLDIQDFMEDEDTSKLEELDKPTVFDPFSDFPQEPARASRKVLDLETPKEFEDISNDADRNSEDEMSFDNIINLLYREED